MKLAHPVQCLSNVTAPSLQSLKHWMRSDSLQSNIRSQHFWSELTSLAPLRFSEAAAKNAAWSSQKAEGLKGFDLELSDNPLNDARHLKRMICKVLQVEQVALLVCDEQTGCFVQLEDLLTPGKSVETFSSLNHHTLGFTPDSPLLTLDLFLGEAQPGRVVVAGPEVSHEASCRLLEMLAPTIGRLMGRLLRFGQYHSGSFVQSVLLELSTLLVTAVDRDAVITSALGILSSRLNLDACQYVCFGAQTHQWEVHYESRRQGEQFKITSYSHAGLQAKRRKIKEFSNLVSLLSSMARNRFYLYLNGSQLGERSLSEIFGVKQAKAALLLPVVDLATGEIQGTFNLFLSSNTQMSQEAREVAQKASELVSKALSRVLVLEKALTMASSDELTGLMNRRGYYQRFESELERARRHQTPMCVALIDVDHFKRFNDTYGHLSGDLVLKALAELFYKNLRRSDLVCRFGGEEFAVLLPDTNLKAAYELMERVRQSVEKLEIPGLHGEAMKVTISSGLAEVNTLPKSRSHYSEISETLALADEQLYRAKNQGRNQICYVDPSRASDRNESIA